MERALRRVYELLPNADHKYCADAFRRFAALKYACRKFKLIREATDIEGMRDYLAEIRYALTFHYLGFDIEAEPLGDNTVGPDFKVSRDGNEAYLEVRRFRPTGGGPPLLSSRDQVSDLGPILEQYGDIEKEINKGFAAIEGKFRQLRGADGILAFWNSDDGLDEVSLEHAVRVLNDNPGIHPVPAGLSFVLYASKLRDAGGQKVYCLPMRPLRPHEERWRTELEKL